MIALWLANLAAYSIQLAVLVATAVLVLRAVPMRDPAAQLKLWHGVLIAAVVLPLLEVWAGAARGGRRHHLPARRWQRRTRVTSPRTSGRGTRRPRSHSRLACSCAPRGWSSAGAGSGDT